MSVLLANARIPSRLLSYERGRAVLKWICVTLLIAMPAWGVFAHDRGLFTEKEKKAIEEQIRAEFDGLIEAAKSLDADSYLAYFDEKNFTGLNADGTVTHSLEEFADLYRKSLPLFDSYEYLEFFRVKVTVLNATTAILVNEFQADIKLQKGSTLSVSGGGTQVWYQKNGEWKLINVSSSAPKD